MYIYIYTHTHTYISIFFVNLIIPNNSVPSCSCIQKYNIHILRVLLLYVRIYNVYKAIYCNVSLLYVKHKHTRETFTCKNISNNNMHTCMLVCIMYVHMHTYMYNKYMHIYTCIHIHTDMYKSTCIVQSHIYLHIKTQATDTCYCIHLYVYTYTSIYRYNIHISMYKCILWRMYDKSSHELSEAFS